MAENDNRLNDRIRSQQLIRKLVQQRRQAAQREERSSSEEEEEEMMSEELICKLADENENIPRIRSILKQFPHFDVNAKHAVPPFRREQTPLQIAVLSRQG